MESKELIHVTDWLPTLVHIGACGVTETLCTGPDLGPIDGVNQVILSAPSQSYYYLFYMPVI